MALAELERLLHEAIGLTVASVGSSTIDRAVNERMAICQLASPEAYLVRVRSSGAELQALIDTVIVPETWFFRDHHAFEALARLAGDEWLATHPGDVLALLSLPCSTGEEPYSMTMALFDAGMPADRFRVDAVDISARNILLSERGVYGRNSFRGDDLGFRDRYFDKTDHGFSVKGLVRRQVRFERGNLLADDFLPDINRYDVIFCRNVLIYFDRPTQDRALGILKHLLHEKGVLFVAPSETTLPAGHGMVSTREPQAFAFRKAVRPPAHPKRTAARAARAGAEHRSPVPSPAPSAGASTKIAPHVADTPSSVADLGLDDAARLADQGRFGEAAVCCDAHIRRHGPSAAAFYLKGLVQDAIGGSARAAISYRKAIYLDPNHCEAQLHLALLMEKQGDAAGAQLLRARARRIEHKGRTPDA